MLTEQQKLSEKILQSAIPYHCAFQSAATYAIPGNIVRFPNLLFTLRLRRSYRYLAGKLTKGCTVVVFQRCALNAATATAIDDGRS
jgi:hypothetical protein